MLSFVISPDWLIISGPLTGRPQKHCILNHCISFDAFYCIPVSSGGNDRAAAFIMRFPSK